MNSSSDAFPFKYHHALSTVIIEIVNKIVESQAAACWLHCDLDSFTWIFLVYF